MRAATAHLALGAGGVIFEEADQRLPDAAEIRVDAHRRREGGALTVHDYPTALRWLRAVEYELGPIRGAAAYACSRAYELCTVHTADFYRAPDGARNRGLSR